MPNHVYNGLFLSPDIISDIRNAVEEAGIETNERDVEISSPHITLEYRGEESYSDHFGAIADVKIVGYASERPEDSKFDGKVEAVAVEVNFRDNPELQTKFETSEVYRNENCGRENGFMLHITLSRDEDTRPVEAGHLNFIEIPEEKQSTIEGLVFGAYYSDGVGVDIGDTDYKDLENNVVSPDSFDEEDKDIVENLGNLYDGGDAVADGYEEDDNIDKDNNPDFSDYECDDYFDDNENPDN